ncbi:alpha-hydroxy-acid oxidizing enzyme [Desulfonema ishimotonii]|uniref:Alpha-hydroxy-acid oxidizing enzyme n=1 Tax=Desulfonema ishimotonii TaxID=45657 RepID=A0A401FSG6_9BACT|nr:alpha-hydroxy-acid oxidizing protein [Desulfonema ishimotonii]GBC59909.1 alpha-hydroxy-acid oxidizing enzyme [Desulfonema ishimotonii]
MKEVRQTAKERMRGFCRVCPVCSGKACAGEVPGMGGLGTGAAFMANVDALAACRFNMRLLHDIAEPDTRIDFLGIPLDMPVLAAPIGGVSFNMGGKISEEAYIQAVLGGCVGKGTLGGVGDGVPAFIHETGYDAIRALDGQGIPFIKPWEDQELYEKLGKAATTGASVVGMDIDAAGLITLKQMGRPVSPKPPEKLREIIGHTPMKFILKGIMTPDEARMAVDVGADAIVVSNHGGRVLDHTPGVAEVLSEVADAVKGQILILADGGVRSGGDVLKMLALGADAVMIGRPFSVAAMGGLKEGVVKYLEQIRSELVSAMVLTGCKSVTSVGRSVLYKQTIPL